MKRTILIVLSAMLLFSFALAEEKAEPDLDLTLLSGSPLIARLNEIKADPAPYAGQSLRVLGQYYEDETRRALIIHSCGLNSCEETGLTLIIPEGAEFTFPKINEQILVEATVEPFETVWGTPSARLILSSVTIPAASTHGL